MSSPVFDLGSILDVQTNYIQNLSPDDSELAGKLTQVDSNLSSLKTSYDNANISANDILTKQQEVDQIVSDENNRLNDVKQTVEDVLTGEKRNIQLNETYRLRQQQYTKMKIIISFALLLCVLFTLLGKYIPVIPSAIITILIIITMTSSIIWCISIYTAVLRRDKNNYNELDIDNTTYPSTSEASEQQRRAMLQGDLIGSMGHRCTGEECCNPKPVDDTSTNGQWTKWDETQQKCLPDEGFTTIQSRFTTSEANDTPNYIATKPTCNVDKYSNY